MIDQCIIVPRVLYRAKVIDCALQKSYKLAVKQAHLPKSEKLLLGKKKRKEKSLITWVTLCYIYSADDILNISDHFESYYFTSSTSVLQLDFVNVLYNGIEHYCCNIYFFFYKTRCSMYVYWMWKVSVRS